MSEPGSRSSTPSAVAPDAAKRARVRQEMDKRWVEEARRGDSNAFGRLFDEWADHVHDYARVAGADETQAADVVQATFEAAWRDLPKLKTPGAFGAQVMRIARREVAALGLRRPAGVSGPTAEDRLNRATNVGATAADPEVAALLHEAAGVLDPRSRDVLALTTRHGLTPAETAAVLGEDRARVDETLGKLPTALAALTRARLLWRGGRAEPAELSRALSDAGVERFGPDAVRTINQVARTSEQSRARALLPIAPIELYAAVPLEALPDDGKDRVARDLAAAGVPLALPESLSAPSRAEADAGEAPGDEPGTESSADEETSGLRPAADVAAVAAAALAAEKSKADEPPATDAEGRGRGRSTAAAAGAAAGAVAASGRAAAAEGGDGGDPGGPSRALLWAGAAVAAVVVLVVVLLVASGGDDQQVSSGSATSSTTTTATSSTTTTAVSTPTSSTTTSSTVEESTTTVAPGQPVEAVTTSPPAPAPAPDVPVGGPPEPTPSTAPTPSNQVPTTQAPTNVSGVIYLDDPDVPQGYSNPAQPGRSRAPELNWEVTSDRPVTIEVSVSGPTGSFPISTDPVRYNVPICPRVNPPWLYFDGTCNAPVGSYLFTLRVTPVDGSAVRVYQAVLSIVSA